MKKLLGVLGTIITAGSGTLTLVANSPSSVKTEEKILKRTKRWGEVQWVQIAQQWRNAELAYQRAGEEFQRNQNHSQFSQAQQHFLQAQQSFNNSAIEWQQGLAQWANQLAQERSQQWWNNNNSQQARKVEKQWVHDKVNIIADKLGVQASLQKTDQILEQKNFNDCVSDTAAPIIFGGAVAGIGSAIFGFGIIGIIGFAVSNLAGVVIGLVKCSI